MSARQSAEAARPARSKGKRYGRQCQSSQICSATYVAAQAHLPGKRLRTDYTDADPDLEADFYILRHTTAPAVLTENFFMDSHPDCTFLLSPEGQQAIVSLHVTGIINYLGLH